MLRTPVLLVALALFLSLSLPLSRPLAAGTDDPPNIVLIVADDLGWTDCAFMGSDYHRTPHLDRLAAEGMVFTHAYACAANCAPSRAALLSGQYAPRTGVYTVGSPDRGQAHHRRLLTIPNRTTMANEVVTLAETIAGAGYDTAAIGKWHLGAGDDGGPLAQGFARNVGGNRAGHPRSYRSPYRNADLPDGPEGEYLTTRLTDEAIAFATAPRERPFFLYFPMYTVHTPIQPETDRLETARGRPRGVHHHRPRYAAMVEGMDANIGRLLGAIDVAGLRERTIVVFTSDNGGHGGFTSAHPLRGAKGMFHEGGIRVPLVVRWPGHVPAGARCATPVIGVDLYPTFAEIAGASLPDATPLDGVSVLPLLEATAPLEPRPLYWHFPAYLEAGRRAGTSWRTTPVGAIRFGPWKLLEFFEDGRTELYDLGADPGEAHDLSATMPAKRDELLAMLRRWREATGAPVPTEPNPAAHLPDHVLP